MFRSLAASTPAPVRLILASLITCAAIGLAAPHAAFADDDPPSRVGRLAVIDGTVSFHTADQQTWGAAAQNYPITTGNALWADANSHAAVQIGGNDINLGSQSELDIDQLTDQTFQASLPQGSVYLNLRNLNQGDQYQIATPRGTVNISQPGRYEIYSGDQTHPSQVTVLEGAAQINGDNNLNLAVGAGQSGVLSDDGQGGQVRADLAQAPGEDNLVAWARSREPQAAPPPEAAAMTGTQDLGRYGNWSSSPDYGNVWYPQVAADWVPYRAGHWAWVAPWGWTWVDDAPWGFAPFHYGRWVQIGPRWAWAPRPVVVVAAPVVPVYAPALVTFIGDIGGVGIGVSIGGPSVGWVPLAPREVYYPSYRCSPRYARNVNVTYVKNVNIINVHNTTIVNNNVTVNRFANHGAVTVVNRDVMSRSQHVSGAVQHVNQQDLNRMRGFNGDHAPLKPTAQTAGLTTNEAKRFGVSPQEIHQTASAGPAIKERGNRNWNNQNNQQHASPAVDANGKPQNVQVKNGQSQAVQMPNAQQNNQLQGGQGQNGQTNKHWSNQNKWASQGSHKPGAAVAAPTNNGQPNAATAHDQQKQNGGQVPAAVSNSQQPGNQQPGKAQLNNGQVTDQGTGNTKQRKWDWSKNQQSHQPGAPVQTPTANGSQVNQLNGKQPVPNAAQRVPDQQIQSQQQLQNQVKQNQARQQESNQQQLQKQQWQQQEAVQRQQQEQAKQQQAVQRQQEQLKQQQQSVQRQQQEQLKQQQQSVQRQQQEQLKQQQQAVQRQQAQQQEQMRQQQHQAEQQRVQQQQNEQRANQQHNKQQQPVEPLVQPQ